LEKTDGPTNFTRYVDDVIVHCKSKVHAEQMLGAISSRKRIADKLGKLEGGTTKFQKHSRHCSIPESYDSRLD